VTDCKEAAIALGADAIYTEPFTEQGDLSALSIWG
jgi:hypothetical protein